MTLLEVIDTLKLSSTFVNNSRKNTQDIFDAIHVWVSVHQLQNTHLPVHKLVFKLTFRMGWDATLMENGAIRIQ